MWHFWRGGILVKATCFALAVCLWMYVVASGQRVETFAGLITVQTLNLENGLSVAVEPKQIKLQISAAPGRIKTLAAEDFFVWVNLKGRTEGGYTVPLEFRAPEGVKVLEKMPASVMVKIEGK